MIYQEYLNLFEEQFKSWKDTKISVMIEQHHCLVTNKRNQTKTENNGKNR